MVAVFPDNASTAELQCHTSSPLFVSTSSPNSTTSGHLYKILDKRVSECALVLFSLSQNDELVVIKILREYQDTRYSLANLKERQRCQIEALKRNRVFTPEIYIGLVPVHRYDPGQGWIEIGNAVEHPTEKSLDPDKEYALLMHRLPEDRRLDVLLKDENSLWQHVQILTEHIVYVHTKLISPISNGESAYWGSYEQLYAKLLHNLDLLGLVSVASTNSEDRETLSWLKETLLKIFLQEQYHTYFEQRVQNQRIKHCHGDLKSPNIWILPNNSISSEHSGQYVKILDAIDFNPLYCTVDILSDFAMLVIDTQVRTGSASLADKMIEHYLHLTNQKDEISRLVLAYYLVEKAIVGAAISIVYDDLPQLGANLLEVAQMRLESLVAMRPIP